MVANFGREIGSIRSQFKLSIGALIGIAQRLVCDQNLSAEEIYFLNNWPEYNMEVSRRWPGNILHTRVREVLADGIVTEDERASLTKTLVKLISGAGEDPPKPAHVAGLTYDDVHPMVFAGKSFCFTGDFVFGPRKSCESVITKHGGAVSDSVNKEVHYLVIGSLGSPEWKHGAFGVKIEKSMEYKHTGLAINFVREDWWTRCIGGV